jgi:parvulin-like peptidyl-prolyl isomerase
MIRQLNRYAGLLAVCCITIAPLAQGGEVLEEIVAQVNGDIITKSDYEVQQEALVAEAYRELTGDELDTYLEQMRKSLLMSMIDRKILVDQAQRIYDLDVMGNAFLEQFKQQQNITNDSDLEKLLAQEGMSVEDLKLRLVEMSAPDEVIRFEVRSRVSVSDAEIEAFYAENQDKLMQPGQVTLREIVLLAPEGTDRAARREEAQAVRRRVVEGGEDFAAVAEEVSEAGTRSKGGMLGEMKKGDLAEHLAGPAFATPIGSVSDVIVTSYGFHILQVEARELEHVTPLEEVRGRLREVLQQSKFAKELEAYLVKVRAESEWCVNEKYRQQFSIPQANACEES